jgi:hypothetical protein
VTVEQYVMNWLFAAVGATTGWLVKVLWDAVGDLKRDLGNLERNLPSVYVRRDDFRDVTRELKDDMRTGFAKIEATLNVLFKRLDSKEDK